MVCNPGRTAAYAFGFCVLILLIGHQAGSNVLGIALEVGIAAPPDSNFDPIRLKQISPALAGYLANVIHGFFYLTIGPLSIYLGLKFVKRLNDLLGSLLSDKLLVPKEVADATRYSRPSKRPEPQFPNSRFLTKVACQNYRFFRYTPLLFLAGIAWNGLREMNSWRDSATIHGGVRSFGSMQAPFFPLWSEEFKKRTHEEKLKKLRTLENWDEIKYKIADGVRLTPRLSDDWGEAKLLKADEIPLDGDAYSELGERADLAKFVDVEKAFVENKWTVDSIKQFGGSEPGKHGWFYLFFALVVFLEGCFHAFALWLMFKFIFWLALVNRLLPPTATKWELVPFFRDKKFQCGLGEIHRTYNFIVFTAGVAVLAYLMHRKGNYPNIYAGSSQFVANVMIGAGALISIVAIWLLPIYLNFVKIGPAREAARNVFTSELKAVADQEAQAVIKEKRDLVDQQVTWPAGDKQFWYGALLVVLAIVLPWLPATLPPSIAKVFEPASKYMDVAAVTDMVVRRACEIIYGIPAVH